MIYIGLSDSFKRWPFPVCIADKIALAVSSVSVQHFDELRVELRVELLTPVFTFPDLLGTVTKSLCDLFPNELLSAMFNKKSTFLLSCGHDSITSLPPQGRAPLRASAG